MAVIPRSRPVAFRMPCCDSLNTVSPRFFGEIFNGMTPAGNYLAIDSSVFQLFTANDPRLPRDRVLDDEGRERFRRYLPADRTFVNRIDDYPYPYVIGRLCWEFPCIVPSDWESFHLQGANNPQLVADLQAGARLHGRQARNVHAGVSSARLDQERSDHRVDRSCRDEAWRQGEIPELSRSA